MFQNTTRARGLIYMLADCNATIRTVSAQRIPSVLNETLFAAERCQVSALPHGVRLLFVELEFRTPDNYTVEPA
jgi:hypothetical protein